MQWVATVFAFKHILTLGTITNGMRDWLVRLLTFGTPTSVAIATFRINLPIVLMVAQEVMATAPGAQAFAFGRRKNSM